MITEKAALLVVSQDQPLSQGIDNLGTVVNASIDHSNMHHQVIPASVVCEDKQGNQILHKL